MIELGQLRDGRRRRRIAQRAHPGDILRIDDSQCVQCVISHRYSSCSYGFPVAFIVPYRLTLIQIWRLTLEKPAFLAKTYRERIIES